MASLLRLLLIEDDEDDALLIVRELRRGGYEPTWERVDTAAALAEALERQTWDVITCDWVMPQFSAPAALEVLHEHSVDVPVIIVSGEVAEEVAVTAMKAGADDFVSKHKLARLVPAVQRELREAEGRRARKQAEAALQRSEERYRSLIENLNDVVFTTDVHGNVTYISPAIERASSLPAEQLIGQHFSQFIHPDDLPAGQDGLARMLAGQLESFEFRAFDREGRVRHFRASARPQLENGRLIGLSGICTDITERKEAEEAGRASERKYRDLIEAAHEVIWSANAAGRCTFVNRAVRNLLGYEPEEVLGRPFVAFVSASRRNQILEFFARIFTNGSEFGFEIELLRRDGVPVIVNINAVAVRDERGHAVGATGTFLDITERKRAEEQLAESVAHLRAIFEAEPECVKLLDREGRLVEMNPAGLAMIEADSLEQVRGQPMGERVVSRDRPAFLALTERVFRGESATLEFEVVGLKGTRRWLETHATPLRDTEGRITLLVGVTRDITERKQAERRVADALNYSQTMLDASPVGILTYAASGDAISANEACARLTGATLDQVKAQNFRKLQSWQESGLLAAAEKALATGQELQIETHVISSFGKPVWLAVRFVPFQFAGETRLLTLSMDIGDRKRAEEALRANEERLKVGVRVADIAVFNQDRELRYTWMHNPQLGYTIDQVLGKTDAELVPAADAGRITALKRRVLETNEGAREEVHVTKDGRVLVYDLALEPLRDATGAVIGLTGASFDITDRKHAEEALAKNAQSLAAAQSIAHVGSWEWNIETGELLWSDETYRILGLQPGQVKPSYELALQLAHPHDRERYEATLQRAVESGERFSVETRIVRADGTEGTLIVAGDVLGVKEGQPRVLMGVAQDITERKRAEAEFRQLNTELEERVRQRTAELEAANQELEAFSFTVSHDLQAPLRHIEGFSKALLEDYPKQIDARGQSYLQRIEAATRHMGDLINDLLGLSQVARGDLRYQRVDLSALAHTIAAELREHQPERPVEFVIAPGMVARGDVRLLRVVLENLLGNAWKYTSKQPAARIEFGGLADGVWQMADGRIHDAGRGGGGDMPSAISHQPVFFVRDNGAGFDMRHADKLFRPFQRLHGRTEFEGTGIGLATVQRIIHRHGGRVWAESTLEQGATFYFTIPASPPAPSAKLPAS